MCQIKEHHSGIVRYWDAVAARYCELFRDELQSKPYDLNVLNAFATSVGRGARVCDVGCGPCAHVTRYLADQGLDMVGIDLSAVCVALARREQPSLQFFRMDMGTMAFREDSFDGLVAYYALHYQPKSTLDAVIREFARILRPGGKLLVVVKEGNGEGWIPDPLGSGQQVFWCAFTPSEVQSLLANNGFQIVSSDVREPLPDEIRVRRIYVSAQRTL